MASKNQLRIAFYGDDITGSTDSMEALVLAGIPTLLFFEPPTVEQISEEFPGIEAVGLAGMSRTMTPAEMDAALPKAFASLKALGAPLIHYKVCSTFDSAPEIGSIGHALDIGADIFKPAFVPVIVGAPKLKRFVIFGNLFATLEGKTYRIDRHPVMSKHPITPMDESDLRLHLGKQTDKKIGLLDIHHLQQADADIELALREIVDEGCKVVILDTVDQEHLLKVGRLLATISEQDQSFVVGSSGVEFALAEYLQSEGKIQEPDHFTSPGPMEQVVAISGSASPWTACQIKRALEDGFHGIQLASARLVDPETEEAERKIAVDQAVHLIQEGKSVLLYSALGPDDPQIRTTKEKVKSLGILPGKVGEILGTQQGIILKDILNKTGLRRAAVAGGDTCGHVMKQLSVYVLEFIIPLGLAAPLCRASSHDPIFDQIEIALKGGQLGDINFFSSLRNGG